MLVLSAQVIAELGESASARPVPRAPKTAKTTTETPSTTTVSKATHAPYLEYRSATSPKPSSKGKATHRPYPYDQYLPRATHAPFPPRSTYAPYVYGSEVEPAKKKNVFSMETRDVISSWAREFIAYLAAPLLMPVAITNAFNTPPGLPEQSSLWGKIARSFRLALLRRSEDRDGSETLPVEGDGITEADKLLMKMKSKFNSALKATLKESIPKILKKLREKAVKDADKKKTESAKEPQKESENEKQKEKKSRLLPARLVDFLRWKRHRTEGPASPSL